MWIDKVLYWKDDGNDTKYPAPTEKHIEYASVQYSFTDMRIACAVYDNEVKTEINAEEIDWHRKHGAEIKING